MKIEINIDDRIVERVRAVSRRRSVRLSGAAVALTVSAIAYADYAEFSGGTPISASVVNGLFNDLDLRVTDVTGDVTGLQSTVGGLQTSVSTLESTVNHPTIGNSNLWAWVSWIYANGWTNSNSLWNNVNTLLGRSEGYYWDGSSAHYYSTQATYQAATSVSYTGAFGSYAWGNYYCAQRIGAASAHMCSSEEIARSIGQGKSIPEGWYSSFQVMVAPTFEAADCQGWSVNTSNYGAHTWDSTKPRIRGCETSFPILCCN